MKSLNIRGNALIEFALVSPILLVLLFGTIEFGVIFYDKAVITNASREGARYGVIYRSPTYASSAQVTTYVQGYCTGKLVTFSGASTSVSVTVTPSSASPTTGDTLKVTVSYIYTDLVLNRLSTIAPQITLTSSTVMTYE